MAKRRKQTKTTRDDDAMLFDASAGGGDGGGGGGDMSEVPGGGEAPVALHEAAQQRYLNYALSVITSRALPDVRDGLKPVQRRILYTMFQQRLTADAKHRKSAKVVGDVMGNYHPHGDQAIYDALVRLAQPWVMRERLIDGSGNFGSPDGDPPAAMRYTECRLTEIAAELIREINQDTVRFRPNYDGSRSEPVVLPARVPTLLLEGSTGIAVGMATSIPPHNLGEVCNALLKLLKSPELQPYQLIANDAILGPDFPTGGQILAARQDMRSLYETGQGTFKLRGLTEAGPTTRSTKTLYITSIPYSVNKAVLVERIAEVINGRKLPPLTDVRDLSTDDTRIALELKRDADEQKVLAYLYKNTPLQVNFSVNLTALVPTENPDVGNPERLDLKSILWHFLHFRLGVVTRRLEHELRALNKRLHILEGFALVFDALDEIIAIIRKSEGKADAAEKIMARFPMEGAGSEERGAGKESSGEPASGGSAGGRTTKSKKKTPPPGLDAEQTDAILELKLYRLARLEINLIRDELDEKRKRRGEIEKLLAEDDTDTTTGRWRIVRDEIKEIAKAYARTEAGKRGTLIEAAEDEPAFSAEDFIVAEDNHVLVTRDGWVKRQKEIKDPQATRLREGDAVLACEAGSTRSTFAFFSNFGVCYTARIVDLPATTGYGEPIQKLFKLKDGETIVAAMSLDPRVLGDVAEEEGSEYAPPNHAFAASSDGYALRFGLASFVEPSTRNGRRYARPAKGARIVGVEKIHGSEILLTATQKGRALVCPAEEVNYLVSAGKGVQLIKLTPGDELLGFKASTGDRDLLSVETNRGAVKNVSTAKYSVTSRGGKGWEVQKTGTIDRILRDPVPAPPPLDGE